MKRVTSVTQIRHKRIGDADAIGASAVPMRVDTDRRQLGWGRTYGAWRGANTTGQGKYRGGQEMLLLEGIYRRQFFEFY